MNYMDFDAIFGYVSVPKSFKDSSPFLLMENLEIFAGLVGWMQMSVKIKLHMLREMNALRILILFVLD